MQNPHTQNPFYTSSRRASRRRQRFELYKQILTCQTPQIKTALAQITADKGHIQAAQHYFYPLLRAINSDMPHGLQGLRDLPKIKKECWEARDAVPSFYFIFMGFCLGLGLETEVEKWLKIFDSKSKLPASLLNHQAAPNLFILGITHLAKLKNWNGNIAPFSGTYFSIDFCSRNRENTIPVGAVANLYEHSLPPAFQADIEVLSISNADDICFFRPAQLTQLKTIYLNSATITNSISNFIAQIPNLRYIALNKCINYKIIFPLHKPSLQRLEILDCPNPDTHLPPLQGLANLQKLVVNGISKHNAIILDELAHTPKLETLELATWGYAPDDNNKIKDLAFLQFLPSLQNLRLQHHAIQNLNPIRSAPCAKTLQTLELFGCKIENIEGLHTATALKNLNLSNNQIKNISPLANLINLQTCNLSTNLIADASPLLQLKNLLRFSISANQLQSCPPAYLVRLNHSQTSTDTAWLLRPTPKNYEKIWALLQTKDPNNIELAEQLAIGLAWEERDFAALKELSRLQSIPK